MLTRRFFFGLLGLSASPAEADVVVPDTKPKNHKLRMQKTVDKAYVACVTNCFNQLVINLCVADAPHESGDRAFRTHDQCYAAFDHAMHVAKEAYLHAHEVVVTPDAP